jgi:hypothetical protein
MAEPNTTAAATAAGAITAASMLPGIDPNTLIGACAGATLFVMSARDLCIFTRLIYLAISIAMGYIGGPPVLGHLFGEPAVSAFVGAATVIGVGLKIINSVDEIDLNKWFRPKG